MKGLYANNIYYEDHNRFLKLIYYIEGERVQVDVTEKVNNYYIQGKIARHRKFDPERLKEAKDEKMLEVDGNFVKQMENMRKKKKEKKSFLQNLIKIKKTGLAAVQHEMSNYTLQDDPEMLSVGTHQTEHKEGDSPQRIGHCLM
jgi:hypothetical protein